MSNGPTKHTCCPGRKTPAYGRKTPGCPGCGVPARPAAPAPERRTQHTCCEPGRGPGFRRTKGCPRCEELDAGATPREANAGNLAARRRTENDADFRRRLREHNCRTARCGPVCTAFDY